VCHDEMREEFRCYSTWPPFHNTNVHLPTSPSEQNITLRLYTNHNSASPQYVDPSDPSTLHFSKFNSAHETKFVVHGFTDNANSQWLIDIKDALLRYGANVILVDWSKGAKGPNYFQAAANTRVVGAHIASLVLVAEQMGASPSSSHVIGHSLGAHIAGSAGRKLNGRLGRISGLDPAAPLFDGYEYDVKLDRTDAQFVDVIHTDAEPLHEAGLGSVQNNAHVDFYPNGGEDMPGCPPSKIDLVSLLSGGIDSLSGDVSCSHNRAPLYFLASIHDNLFQSYPCADRTQPQLCNVCGSGCTSMGYHATPDFSGVYVLNTGENYPY